MSGWELVVGFNLITAAAYVGIAWFIVRGLVSTGQLLRNYLAVATAAIFSPARRITCCTPWIWCPQVMRCARR